MKPVSESNILPPYHHCPFCNLSMFVMSDNSHFLCANPSCEFGVQNIYPNHRVPAGATLIGMEVITNG